MAGSYVHTEWKHVHNSEKNLRLSLNITGGYERGGQGSSYPPTFQMEGGSSPLLCAAHSYTFE